MTNIHTIFTQELENGGEGELGIDDQANLYWNKKAVVTEQKVKLQFWVNISVFAASLSTITIAAFTALQFFGFGSNG